MIRISKLIGIFMMLGSALLFIIYTLWMLGFISGLDPNLAIKISVYIIVIAILAIIGILGYIMATYTHPAVIRPLGGK